MGHSSRTGHKYAVVMIKPTQHLYWFPVRRPSGRPAGPVGCVPRPPLQGVLCVPPRELCEGPESSGPPAGPGHHRGQLSRLLRLPPQECGECCSTSCLMVSPGVSWCFWCLLVSSDVFWCLLVSSDFSWCVWCLLVSSGVFWCLLVSPGVF